MGLLPAFPESVFSAGFGGDRARITLDSIADAVLTADARGLVTYLNPVAEAMTGWSFREAIAQPVETIFQVIDSRTRQPFVSPLQRLRQATPRTQPRDSGTALEYTLIRRDGFEYIIEDSVAAMHDTQGATIGAVIVFHDITASRAAALRMAHLAQHDFLTGLPNRVLLCERLALAIVLARRHKNQVGILFLDIDNFKQVNDSLGHTTGDRLLQSVGRRLVSCVRGSDTVCRQGGDEFVVLLTEIETPLDAARISENIVDAFLNPHYVGEQELRVTLSIGISIYPDIDDIEESAQHSASLALQNADTAMYHAKLTGRNNYQFFQPIMNVRATRRLMQKNGLRRALKHDEFVLHYQPQVNLESGSIIGAEALIRWRDPEAGLIFPEQFIGEAEECGLIVPLGKWVLRETCRQIRAWLDAGLAVVPISINVSSDELCHRDFSSGVRTCLREFNLHERCIELELTESVLMRDMATTAYILSALRNSGIRIALDDFGKGYSSLSYLKQLPISTLKIDHSFIQDIENEEDGRSIVGAIISMGKSLGQRVIAEGVTNEKQRDVLLNLHCEAGQGILFSPPLSADEFGALLGKNAGN
ncbi:MAG: EAL domain-containing protein [Cellvibrionaceae bacterium]|nr:EAL domain-containing protein [Cellvibrionaceae bacterium]